MPPENAENCSGKYPAPIPYSKVLFIVKMWLNLELDL
jgi:hypothetical protein